MHVADGYLRVVTPVNQAQKENDRRRRFGDSGIRLSRAASSSFAEVIFPACSRPVRRRAWCRWAARPRCRDGRAKRYSRRRRRCRRCCNRPGAGRKVDREVLVDRDVFKTGRCHRPDDAELIDEVGRSQTEVDRQIALVEGAGVGVGFAAEGPLIGRAFVGRGVERSANAGSIVRGTV